MNGGKSAWVFAFLAAKLLAILPLTCTLKGSDRGNGEQQTPTIRAVVVNTARVEEKTLSTALRRGEVIFRDAGVRLTWVRCPGPAQRVDPSECRPDEASTLFLRIVRQPPSGFGSRHALGQAFSGEVGSQYATVFHDRVLAMVGLRKPGSEALLLAHVIAHELGHLLLRTSTHASFGLMAAGWNITTLEHAPCGLLEFAPADGAAMRAEAIRRSRELRVSTDTSPLAQNSEPSGGDHPQGEVTLR